IKSSALLTKEEIEKDLNFKLLDQTILVTFHPVTLERNTAADQFRALLDAIDYFQDLRVIFTKPNADTNGRAIIQLIEEYVDKNSQKAIAFTSLGQQKYLSTLQYVSMVVGNSSSGIIEVPSFGIPTVNIGDRQKGRVQADSIINCLPQKETIISALSKAMDSKFRAQCKNVKNPYGDGGTATKIINILKEQIGKIDNTKKSFYNLGV
ncbi:MAG: UDP-N-acetylglucosamine 2-epimerase, partial [Bacteroidota bacterium]